MEGHSSPEWWQGWGAVSRTSNLSPRSNQRFLGLQRTADPAPPGWAPTYCLCVGAVGPEGNGHGVEHAHLASHLLHSPHCALLVGIGELDHQTG